MHSLTTVRYRWGYSPWLGLVITLCSVQELAAQTADAKVFSVVAAGVVKDTRTGLEWMRCSLGQEWSNSNKTCVGEIKKFNWQGAQDAAARQNSSGGIAGRAGWRVPNVRELQSIRYCSKGAKTEKIDLLDNQPAVSAACANGSSSPTIDGVIFPSTPDTWYWTSTAYTGYPAGAWYVHFFNGLSKYTNYRGNYVAAVRLVR
jgi:hypothetical protein